MSNIGWWEITLVVVLALIILGPKKLPELGSSLGRSIRGFRKGLKEVKEEVQATATEVRQAAGVDEVRATVAEMRDAVDVRKMVTQEDKSAAPMGESSRGEGDAVSERSGPAAAQEKEGS